MQVSKDWNILRYQLAVAKQSNAPKYAKELYDKAENILQESQELIAKNNLEDLEQAGGLVEEGLGICKRSYRFS